jgi:hypothetical protein
LPLSPGSTLGPYEILAPLGDGGGLLRAGSPPGARRGHQGPAARGGAGFGAVAALSAGASMPAARLACICYQAGDTSRGDEVFAQLKKRSEEAYVAPSVLAWVYMARGENDQAARLLEQAREINDPMFVATRVYTRPFFPSGSAVDAILKKAGW